MAASANARITGAISNQSPTGIETTCRLGSEFGDLRLRTDRNICVWSWLREHDLVWPQFCRGRQKEENLRPVHARGLTTWFLGLGSRYYGVCCEHAYVMLDFID